MANILLRGLSPDVLAQIDNEAAERGLSRNRFLVELIGRPYREPHRRNVTVADFERFAAAAADLADPEIMAEAWR